MPNNRYSAVIFDFDYTLADATDGIVTSFSHAFNTYGFVVPSVDDIRRTVGMVLPDGLRTLSRCEDDAVIEELRLCFIKKADEVMTGMTKFLPYSAKLLDELRLNAVKSAVVTSKYRYRVEDFLLRNSNSVDLIIGYEDVSNHKPDPEGLLKAIDYFKLSHNEVLYVGDTVIDAQAAQAAGIAFAGVLTGSTTRSDFNDYPSVIIAENQGEILNFIFRR